MTKRLLLLLFLLAAASWLHMPAAAAGDKLVLSQPPRDGVSSGCRVVVEGRAQLAANEHAWVFAARKNFADLGLVWLQGEADVDPSSGEFSFPVTLGIPEDIGANFRISVAILDEETHNRMRARLMDMMTSNRHVPVAFPATVSAPKHRFVKKVNHDGC